MNQAAALVITKPDADPEVIAFYSEALVLQRYAEARVIITAEDMKPANDDLNTIRRLRKAMENKRKDYLSPFQEHVKEVNEAYKRLMAPVEIADKVTSDKMLAFTRAQDHIRSEQEEVNRLRKLAADKDAALHNGEISESVNLVEVIPEVPRRVQTEMGSSGMRDNWQWEVVDFKLVPDEYKVINAGVLTPMVKATKGRVPIPGIRIYNEPIIATHR